MAEILKTERLLLREHEWGDAEVLHRLHSDPLVMKYTCEPMSESLNSMRNTLRKFIAYNTSQPFGRWIVVLEGEVIGWAGPKYIAELNEIDLGYRFSPRYWGKGIATEACQAIISHCFKKLHIKRLVGFVKSSNVASTRVLKKCNFTFENEVRVFNTDALQYGLNHDHWQSVRESCETVDSPQSAALLL